MTIVGGIVETFFGDDEGGSGWGFSPQAVSLHAVNVFMPDDDPPNTHRPTDGQSQTNVLVLYHGECLKSERC